MIEQPLPICVKKIGQDAQAVPFGEEDEQVHGLRFERQRRAAARQPEGVDVQHEVIPAVLLGHSR